MPERGLAPHTTSAVRSTFDTRVLTARRESVCFSNSCADGTDPFGRCRRFLAVFAAAYDSWHGVGNHGCTKEACFSFAATKYTQQVVVRALSEHPALVDLSLVPRALLGLVALLCGNGFIVGINQARNVRCTRRHVC